MNWTHDALDRKFQPAPVIASAALDGSERSASVSRSPLLRRLLAALVGLGFFVYLVGLDRLTARAQA